jgi:hypothetical protein
MKILHISTVQVLLSAEKCSVGFYSYSTWIPLDTMLSRGGLEHLPNTIITLLTQLVNLS